jgi:hypothetical protein
MKARFNFRFVIILTLSFFTFSLSTLMAQEKSKKQLKAEQQLEKQRKIVLLVESKEFVFSALRVIPQSGSALILTSEFDVTFQPDLIKSFLPFIGRGFSGIGYGGDEGMKFEGKPTLYQVEKAKKGYQIKIEVRGKTDFYSMMLDVYYNGSAYLTINSNNRSPISYDGTIDALQNMFSILK